MFEFYQLKLVMLFAFCCYEKKEVMKNFIFETAIAKKLNVNLKNDVSLLIKVNSCSSLLEDR